MRINVFGRVLSLSFVLLLCTSQAGAEPTKLTVRVLSKGAKFIGTSMQGAEVTVADMASGKVLARGITSGSTGSTKTIMEMCRKRHTKLSDPESAAFTCTVDIAEPTYIVVTARGPLSSPASANSASLSQWIFPGRHIVDGDALLLEIPGFLVSFRDPPSDTINASPELLQVSLDITMMCGCPLMPGGLWDPENYDLYVRVRRNDTDTGRIPLRYAGVTSRFTASVSVEVQGDYRIAAYAFDKSNGNTGFDTIRFTVK